MKKKIIFWCDASQIHYGLAKKFFETSNFDIYGIFDIPYKQQGFFRTEEIAGFKKKWFLHDSIHEEMVKREKPDIDYLKEFERKYGINLWLLAYNERLFFRYYNYKKFSENEVLKILEYECKLFEEILKEINPDMLCIITTTHQSQLFYEICKAKKIKILLLYSVRLKKRVQIGTDPYRLHVTNEVGEELKLRTTKELQEFLEEDVLYNQARKYVSGFSNSKALIFKAAKEFLFSPNTIEKTHFTYFGRTKIRVLFNSILDKIHVRQRTNYINKHFVKKINEEDDFIFFPLQQDPERTLLIDAPYKTNQLEVIRNIVQSLPIGKKLYVKEHISQITRNWRDIEFYQELENMPNVVLIHPSIKPSEIFKKCDIVITINSTAAFECLFYNKRSIVLANTIFSELTSVDVVKDLSKLPNVIRDLLEKDVDLDEVNKFVNKIEKNSFEFDCNGISKSAVEQLYLGGNLVDREINENQMEYFLKNENENFTYLANEFFKKINMDED